MYICDSSGHGCSETFNKSHSHETAVSFVTVIGETHSFKNVNQTDIH